MACFRLPFMGCSGHEKARRSGPLRMEPADCYGSGRQDTWRSAMDIDKAVAAVINELERQSREDTLGLYGSMDDPHSFGIDGDVDLVALVRVAIEAAAAPKVRSNDL